MSKSTGVYDVDVEIDVDEDRMTVHSANNEYVYSTSGSAGEDIILKIVGTDVQVTVYAQGVKFDSIEEYNEYKEFARSL